MSDINNMLLTSIKPLFKLITKINVVPDRVTQELNINVNKVIVYVLSTASESDLLAAQQACLKAGLPDPCSPVTVGDKSISRTLFLANPARVFFGQPSPTDAIKISRELLNLQQQHPDLDIQMIPINVTWGRKPGTEKASVKELIAEQNSPSWLRKSMILLTSGNLGLVRFSHAVSLAHMVDNYGSDDSTAHKMLRVARFHFYRQQLAATGPRLPRRAQLFNSILASSAVRKVINDEAKSKNISTKEAKQNAKKLIDEIAAGYSDTTVRLANRILSWLWNKLYRKLEVINAERVRDLADKGHSIVYIPCHRSHMDYLLLSYVIYHEGLVPPHIAAGINLNFWPVGSFFRRGGAFFIRRSFRGNKMYAAIFREYLGQLFAKGYSIEYFCEGGRSRTGRLLSPKTGMLAMTVQGLLRGVERPITFVPIYIGYEHVMEVTTYHSELKGKNKEKESIFGVFKAIRKLRNYGNGYVNFGEPITLNQRLNDEEPQWREAIDPIEQQKPSWLTPFVNSLADDVMMNINKAAALNGATLCAFIILATEKNALPRKELIRQLDFCLKLQRMAPYHKDVFIPVCTGSELLEQTLELDKFQVSNDEFGQIISLDGKAAVEMTYYRNNILHTFVLPATVAAILISKQVIRHEALVEQVKLLYPLLRAEWYLWPSDEALNNEVAAVVSALCDIAGVSEHDGQIVAPVHPSTEYSQLRLFAACIQESVQRYGIVAHLLEEHSPIVRKDLEVQSCKLAERLGKLHGIDAPEFYDNKVFANLTNTLKDIGYMEQAEGVKLGPGTNLPQLTQLLDSIIDPKILQSLREIN